MVTKVNAAFGARRSETSLTGMTGEERVPALAQTARLSVAGGVVKPRADRWLYPSDRNRRQCLRPMHGLHSPDDESPGHHCYHGCGRRDGEGPREAPGAIDDDAGDDRCDDARQLPCDILRAG